MSDKDFNVSAISSFPAVATVSKKPLYLVTLEPSGKKGGSYQKFIAIDKPDSQNGFITAKGFFTESPEDEVIKTFSILVFSSFFCLTGKAIKFLILLSRVSKGFHFKGCFFLTEL